MFKNLLFLVLLLIVCSLGWYLFYPREQAASLGARPSRAEADSFSRKLEQLAAAEKGRSANSVELRQSELNAYVEHELAPLFPKGLEQVEIQLHQGLISGTSRINFDTLETGDGKPNPLLSALLRGEHRLDVVASVKTQNRTGAYEVSKVLLDQREIPKPLVDLLIQKYVVPNYPAAKPNTPFPLPYNIDRADILPGKMVVYQVPR
ncbi:MAG: hypothetical protein L0387_41065 [Acidobacteria bacterium]|nr:hypothetical protein [Acidobacteriota bacterium]MCI0627979.1 hypothetical protein [Acidobacteriota bacterium]MCI0719881.1 hypothetical protein [Acidobacteriota bacterium]